MCLLVITESTEADKVFVKRVKHFGIQMVGSRLGEIFSKHAAKNLERLFRFKFRHDFKFFCLWHLITNLERN